MEIFFLEPVFVETIWGGSKLRDVFGYNIPSDTTGECWAISAHENGECRVAGGTYGGRLLNSLWKEKPDLFGNYPGDKFPLMVKIIDARKDLSIQVHPDDNYAKIHENGSLGKTECWYILDCKPESEIIIGHHAKNQEELELMIQNHKWEELIRSIPIKKGDFFQIEPGCIHAIKEGTLILETQQNSDITYRLYDYDRLYNKKLRQLHIKESIANITVPFKEEQTNQKTEKLPGAVHTHLVSCKFYSVDKYDIDGLFIKEFEKYFTNVSVISGKGSINGISLEAGQHFIIPAKSGECRFEGNMSLICSNPE